MKTLYTAFIVWIALGTLQVSHASSIPSLASDLSTKLEHRQIERLAILPFQALGQGSEVFAKHLTEEFSTALLDASSTIKVYERHQLDKVMNELKLQHSGLVDSSTTQQLGAFTGVEAIVIGEYAIVDKKVKLWIKVLETESAFQVAAAQGEMPFRSKDWDLEQETGQLKVVNKRLQTIRILVIGNDGVQHELHVGGRSAATLINLPEGIYDCSAISNQSGNIEASFQVEIKPRKRSRHKIKRLNMYQSIMRSVLPS